MSTEQDDLTVQQPPPGLNRRERKAWFEAEGIRLANLREPDGGSLLASLRPPVAPRSLGRAGRAAWLKTERHNRRERLRSAVAAEDATGESDRYVGALLLMAAVLIIVGLRVFVFHSSADPAPIAPAPAVVTQTSTYQTTPTVMNPTHTWPGE